MNNLKSMITALIAIVELKSKKIQLEGTETWGIFEDVLILLQGHKEYLDMPCDIYIQ